MGNSGSTVETLLKQAEVLLHNTITEEYFTNMLESISFDDIWMLFGPQLVSKLKQMNPGNIEIILRLCVKGMIDLVHPTSGNTPSFLFGMNCVRVLTRVLPVILADPAEFEEVLWCVEEPVVLVDADSGDVIDEAIPLEIKETEDGIEEADSPSDSSRDYKSEISRLCLAQQIVFLLTRMLFVPDFTISDYNLDNEKIPVCVDDTYVRLLWYSAGLGVPNIYTYSKASYEKNRTEILKCLIVCFSEYLFKPAKSFQHFGNRWIAILTSTKANPLAKTLFFSLLNLLCSYNPRNRIPYSHSVMTDSTAPLVDAALQLLTIVLDHRVVASAIPQPPHNDAVLHSGISQQNIFYHTFVNLKEEKDLCILFNAITNLLSNAPDSRNTYLPGSANEVTCFQELFVILWKLLDENMYFLSYAAKHPDISKLVVPVLFFMLVYRKESSHIGLVQTCTFILLKLSSDRDFAVSLNLPFTSKIPADLPTFSGTLADLLIITIQKLIICSRGHLDNILTVVLTIICNVSPYLTKLCSVSSVKLMNLFELLSSSRFLYGSDRNYRYVSSLVEIINNIVQYQYQGNAPLIYAITRRAHLFAELGRLPPAPNDNKSVEPSLDLQPEEEPNITEKNIPKSKVSRFDGRTQNQLQVQRPLNAPAKIFVPTYEWIVSWKRPMQMQLNTISCMLNFVMPRIESMCRKDISLDETAVYRWLEKTTLVGILPLPHNIVVRRYQPSAYTDLWFSTFIWGIIFLRNPTLFDSNTVKILNFAPPKTNIERKLEVEVDRKTDQKVDAIDKDSDNAVLDEVHADAVIDEVYADAVIDEVHADAVVDEVHADAVIDEAHADAVVDEVHVDAVVDEVHADAVVDEVHVDAVVDEVHVDAVVDEVHVDAVIDEVHADAVIDEV